MPRLDRVALAAAAFVGGVFGAKLPFAFGQGAEADWLADGKTITTGLIGAYLAVELVKLALGVRVKTGDTFALPLALALAVGRWGCFFNGCCHGMPTDLPWGVDFGDGVRRHPTQVYESLFHFGAAGTLIVLMVRGAIPGHRLQLYLIAYAAFRFATEFIRPEPEYALGLTYYQWASVVLGAGLAAQWLWESRCGVTS
jgi:prolipoprotein diacylglyceryltransferase